MNEVFQQATFEKTVKTLGEQTWTKFTYKNDKNIEIEIEFYKSEIREVLTERLKDNTITYERKIYNSGHVDEKIVHKKTT